MSDNEKRRILKPNSSSAKYHASSSISSPTGRPVHKRIYVDEDYSFSNKRMRQGPMHPRSNTVNLAQKRLNKLTAELRNELEMRGENQTSKNEAYAPVSETTIASTSTSNSPIPSTSKSSHVSPLLRDSINHKRKLDGPYENQQNAAKRFQPDSGPHNVSKVRKPETFLDQTKKNLRSAKNASSVTSNSISSSSSSSFSNRTLKPQTKREGINHSTTRFISNNEQIELPKKSVSKPLKLSRRFPCLNEADSKVHSAEPTSTSTESFISNSQVGTTTYISDGTTIYTPDFINRIPYDQNEFIETNKRSENPVINQKSTTTFISDGTTIYTPDFINRIPHDQNEFIETSKRSENAIINQKSNELMSSSDPVERYVQSSDQKIVITVRNPLLNSPKKYISDFKDATDYNSLNKSTILTGTTTINQRSNNLKTPSDIPNSLDYLGQNRGNKVRRDPRTITGLVKPIKQPIVSNIQPYELKTTNDNIRSSMRTSTETENKQVQKRVLDSEVDFKGINRLSEHSNDPDLSSSAVKLSKGAAYRKNLLNITEDPISVLSKSGGKSHCNIKDFTLTKTRDAHSSQFSAKSGLNIVHKTSSSLDTSAQSRLKRIKETSSRTKSGIANYRDVAPVTNLYETKSSGRYSSSTVNDIAIKENRNSELHKSPLISPVSRFEKIPSNIRETYTDRGHNTSDNEYRDKSIEVNTPLLSDTSSNTSSTSVQNRLKRIKETSPHDLKRGTNNYEVSPLSNLYETQPHNEYSSSAVNNTAVKDNRNSELHKSPLISSVSRFEKIPSNIRETSTDRATNISDNKYLGKTIEVNTPLLSDTFSNTSSTSVQNRLKRIKETSPYGLKRDIKNYEISPLNNLYETQPRSGYSSSNTQNRLTTQKHNLDFSECAKSTTVNRFEKSTATPSDRTKANVVIVKDSSDKKYTDDSVEINKTLFKSDNLQKEESPSRHTVQGRFKRIRETPSRSAHDVDKKRSYVLKNSEEPVTEPSCKTSKLQLNMGFTNSTNFSDSQDVNSSANNRLNKIRKSSPRTTISKASNVRMSRQTDSDLKCDEESRRVSTSYTTKIKLNRDFWKKPTSVVSKDIQNSTETSLDKFNTNSEYQRQHNKSPVCSNLTEESLNALNNPAEANSVNVGKMVMTASWIMNQHGHDESGSSLNDFEEEMDWTNAEDETEPLDNDVNMEIPLYEENAFIDPTPTTLENKKEDIKVVKEQYLCIVVDTNVFISDLSKVTDIVNLKISGTLQPLVYIPWMVTTELDEIKDRPGNNSLKQKAFSAIKCINTLISEKNPRFKGQSISDMSDQKQVGSSPDDKIISTCLQAVEKYEDVILLTNDINLRSKAMINDITAVSANEIIMKIMSKTAKQTKFPKITQRLSILCSTIICEYAKDAYGDVWLKMDMLSNAPWSLVECMKRFKKYWSAVFQQKLMKQFITTVDRLYQLLSSNKDICDDSNTYNDFVKLSLDLCIFLKDLDDFRVSVCNVIKEITKMK